MSKDLLKAQATRLAEHLSTKHGVKLKAASLLEAVASMHGARDWNTLIAGSSPLTAPTATPVVVGDNNSECSPSERLLRNVLSSGACEFQLNSPNTAAGETQGVLTYVYEGIRNRVALTTERTAEFRHLLLELASMSVDETPEMHWSYGEFSYQGISGSIRNVHTRHAERLTVEWNRGTSFTRRVESLTTIAPLVTHFASPQAQGMYLVASINGASSTIVTEALASRVPGRSYVETHDFETDGDVHWQRGDIDVAMGELRTKEGADGLLSMLEAGCLSLTRVHAHSIEGALSRAIQVGLTHSDLRQHLRGVLALTSLRTVCTHCAGKGCEQCKKSGVGGIVHLYEFMLLDKAKDYENFAVDKSWGPSLEQQAQALVSQGLVSLEEAQRVFGPEFNTAVF